MIPDKIYTAIYPNDDDEGQHLGDWYSEPEYKAVEYIRKNALLEWAKGLQKKHKGYSDAELIITLDKLIEKIESL